jgi:hypothetical protein
VLTYASVRPARPLLILEPRTRLSARTAGGDQMNLFLSALLDRGFNLLRTGGQLPRPAAGWLLQLGRSQPGSWRPAPRSPGA